SCPNSAKSTKLLVFKGTVAGSVGDRGPAKTQARIRAQGIDAFMKVAWDLVVGALGSLEFFVICVATAFTVLFPATLRRAGAELQSHKEAFQWLSIACVGALIFALRWGHEILVPKHEHARVLTNWPGFF